MPDERTVAAYEDALRACASAAVKARGRTRGIMRNLPSHAGGELLADIEHALSSLIVLGAVPRPRPALEADQSVPAHQEGDSEPTRATVDLLLAQLERDRETPYWGTGRHAEMLAGAESWLLSLRDWLRA